MKMIERLGIGAIVTVMLGASVVGATEFDRVDKKPVDKSGGRPPMVKMIKHRMEKLRDKMQDLHKKFPNFPFGQVVKMVKHLEHFRDIKDLPDDVRKALNAAKEAGDWEKVQAILKENGVRPFQPKEWEKPLKSEMEKREKVLDVKEKQERMDKLEKIEKPEKFHDEEREDDWEDKIEKGGKK